MGASDPTRRAASGGAAPACLAAVLSVLLSGCTLARIVRYGPSDITDYRIFPSRPLQPSPAPAPLPDRRDEGLMPEALTLADGRTVATESFVMQRDAVAYLVVQGGALLYERYAQGYDRSSLVQIFSVSKSITGLLVGCAIRDGYLRGVDQPVVEIIPELESRGFGGVTLEHLLQMTSGSDYHDADSPFSRHAGFYYGTDIVPKLLELRLEEPPGSRFEYRSADTQLLGLILSRVLAPESVTGYAQRALWNPLGMELGGSWGLDREGGLEKTFCCLAMRAIDLARIGVLVSDEGRCGGEQIVPGEWIRRMRSPDTSRGGSPDYSYQWWLLPELAGGLMGSGHRGQYLIVLPDEQLVVVRLGRRGGEELRRDHALFARALAEQLAVVRSSAP